MLDACIGQVRLTAAAMELTRYKLDLVGMQKVRGKKGSTLRAGNYNFLCGKGNESHQFGTGCLNKTEQYQQLRE